MALDPNPVDALDELDGRVGILERKQYAATSGPGVQQPLAVQKWRLNAAYLCTNAAWNDIGPFTQVTADSSDTGGAITVTANPASTIITCNKDGVYTIVWNCSNYPSNATGGRMLRIMRTTDSMIIADSGVNAQASFGTRTEVALTFWAAAGNTYKIQIYQNSGTSMSIPADVAGLPVALWVAFHGNKEPKGDKGDTGAQGVAGQGVPTGGSAGQVLQKNSGTDYDATWATPSAYVSGDEVLISPGTPGAPNFELWVDTDDDTGNTVGSGAYTYKLPGDTMTNATPGTAYSEGITFMDIQSTTSGWPTAAVPCELWCYKSSGQVWQDLLAPNKPSSGVAIRYSRVWDPVAVAWGPWYQDVMSTQSATIITARQDPPRGYMAQNLAQAIPTGAWTLLTNMVARYQKGTPQVTMGTNRLILPIDGLYRITGGVYFASAITLRRGFWFRKNGATTLQQFLWMSNNTVANAGSVSGSADEEFSAGDYLEGLAYQESGANVNTNLGNYFTWLSATWIAPL